MDKDYAQFLLKKTREDYNLIASQFAQTRDSIEPDILELAKLAKPGEKVLDSGCGSGRLYQILKNQKVEYIGVDFSDALIKIAQSRYPEAKFIVADNLALPLPAESFDKVFSLAVLHHLPSEEIRLSYLKQLYRVLKPGGELILRVWNLWRARKAGAKKILGYLGLKILRQTKLDWFDLFLPWKNSKGETLTQLYFHCFNQKELERLTRQAGLQPQRLGLETQNYPNLYLLGEKRKDLTKEN